MKRIVINMNYVHSGVRNGIRISESASRGAVVMVTVEKKIGVTVLMRASRKGGSGLYLYVEGQYADVYGIKPGDRVEARLNRVFTEISDAKPGVVDLTRGNKHRKGEKT